MAKLKDKHKYGTVPGQYKLFEQLTNKELNELAKTKGYEHLFEDEPKKKEVKNGNK